MRPGSHEDGGSTRARRPLVGVAWVTLLLAIASPAQQPLGSTYRLVPSTASRGALLGSPGTLVARFDHDDYVGWGRTTSTPNRRVVRGITFRGEDKNGATAESYSIRMFTEDPARPGFPDLGAPLLYLGPFWNPVRPAGTATFTITQIFPMPLLVPADRDVFVGIELGNAPSWPNDGFTVQCLLGNMSTTWPTYDAPGEAPIQNGGYGLAIDAAGQSFYNSPRQLLIDILCDAPGGACTTLSNQASFPPGATAPGAGGFLSGLHPDVVSPPRNPGRADTPGFAYLDNSLPNGSLVIFLADLGGFGPEVPLGSYVAGSLGSACLKPNSVLSVALGLLYNGECTNSIPIGVGVRSVLQGLPLLQQAIALAPNQTLHGSPCGMQTF